MGGVLFVCTGNASRSVMAEVMLEALAPGWEVASAGTLSVAGRPVGWRTRRVLTDLGYDADRHRSRQAAATDLERADLIAVFEPSHVAWVRREHPDASPRTGSLRRLAHALPTGGPDGADLATRVSSLRLEATDLEPSEEVADPGGGELDDYVSCAAEVHHLVVHLAARLGRPPAPSP